jgi:hypothetical protein
MNTTKANVEVSQKYDKLGWELDASRRTPGCLSVPLNVTTVCVAVKESQDTKMRKNRVVVNKVS